MAKVLGNALGTDMNEIAALLRSKGRRGDTVLAHINPEEAALLKARGGAGTINPETGLPEFFEWTSPSTWFGGGSSEPAQVYDDYPSQQQIDAGTALPTETSSLPEYQSIYEAPVSDYYQQPAPQQFYEAPQTGNLPYIPGVTQPAEVYPSTVPASLQQSVPGAEVFAAPQIAGGLPTAPGAPKPEKGMLESFEDTVKKYPTSSNILGNLVKFGLGGLATVPIRNQQNKAAEQTQAMANEVKALGEPIRQQGLQSLAQAQAGQLTPAQRQSIATSRAQTRQQLERQNITSGVAQQQAEANIQRLTEQYVAGNINNALQMVNLGNRYAQAAITQGYNANNQANQAANLFYQNMFSMLGGYNPQFTRTA